MSFGVCACDWYLVHYCTASSGNISFELSLLFINLQSNNPPKNKFRIYKKSVHNHRECNIVVDATGRRGTCNFDIQCECFDFI